MVWDVVKFLKDFRIQYRQKSSRWINICCPFKHNHKGGDRDYFGGFDLKRGGYNCWSCGGISSVEVIAELLEVSKREARGLLQGYGGYGHSRIYKEKRQNAKMMTIPGTREARERHNDYLLGRGYNPEFLSQKYDLHFTTVMDGPDWENRIVLPITYNHRVVSFQARDITDNNKFRYRSATPEESLVHYKDIIFGLDDWTGDTCGIVEGAFDVYRMGKGVGTGFGSALTDSQIHKLANSFRKIIFMFDPTDQKAWDKAGKHVAEFRSMGVAAERIRWDGGDPDELGFVDCRILKHEAGIR